MIRIETTPIEGVFREVQVQAQTEALVDQIAVEPEMLPYHIPTSFKVGDRVKVVAKVPAAHAWYSEWTAGMDAMIGTVKQVKQVDPLYGFFLGDKTGLLWMPSPALELAGAAPPTVVEVPATSGIAGDQTKPAGALKSRTKAGPWDAAPCTHLRWHLMGFYNEKLKLSVSSVKTNTGMDLGDVGGEADLTFCCVKCDKSIKMTAPIKVAK